MRDAAPVDPGGGLLSELGGGHAVPGKLSGRPVRALLKETAALGGIHRAVGIATMNALGTCWKRAALPDVELTAGVDAYDTAAIQPGDHVAGVRAFVAFLKSLKRARQRFTVLEIDPATLRTDGLPYDRPYAQAGEMLPSADVLLITGTTLLNDTLEHLLVSCRPVVSCRPAARVVAVGPTVSLLPEPFLSRGVDVLSGIPVTAPDRFLDVLAEGGFGYSFLRPLGGEGCPEAPRGRTASGSACARYAGRDRFPASVTTGFL